MSDVQTTRGALYVVLTMRGIHSSKRRLESAVDASARAELNRWLLARTLHVVKEWLDGMGRCLFVTACAEALAIARAAGACAIDEPGGALGHNHAAAVGMAHAASMGGREVMMLPCDLPLLSGGALDAFAALRDERTLVLAADRHGTGTNALIVDAGAGLEFKFGEGSLGLYDAWARSTRHGVAISTRWELAFDLDTPADLNLLRASVTDASGAPVVLRQHDNEEETL
jgi:2-phospho-L-lactate guanylyltransferase